MKALSESEIQTCAEGAILFNDELVAAFDFSGVNLDDNTIKDISPYGNHGTIVGGPTFPEGGAPEGHYALDLGEPGVYMEVDGSANYLEVAHTEDLELGKDNADFTVSFGLIQT